MKISDANFNAALAAVRAKKMSLRQAAKHFKTSHARLHRHTSGKFVFTGPPTELNSEEENKIAEWVIDVSKRGFPLTHSELQDTVQMYLNRSNRVTKFKDNRPGSK